MRSGADSWDIKTSVGSTALYVALARALEARKPEPLVVDRYAELFCQAAGDVWADELDGTAPDHEFENELGEHFVNFMGARTRYLDECLLRAAEAGVRQVVIPAAGLDARAFRLPWADGTVVYELDQPRVLEFKREVLADLSDQLSAERREVAVDLRQDWPHALKVNGFDASRPSAWLVEGLLMYLPGAAQAQLFSGINALASPGSHAAIQQAAPISADVFAAARERERAEGRQAYYSLIYNEQHAPAENWFREHGWTVAATSITDYLRAHGRPDFPAGSEADTMLGGISLVSATKD